ncbi:MAG: SUMF1/EgtB/PvdO family nonheme iron enzyme [Mariniphaga sp.]|nr:SUMF1/EgtB/PvdO family nonheme iron enzyme [Mariniphaga sp.]
MRFRTIAILVILILFFSCQRSNVVYLPEQPDKRGEWFEPEPFGMVHIPRGTFRLGPNDSEKLDDHNASKIVTVEAFWMDDTEITNNEYRQFVHWVRDSIARRLLGNVYADFLISEDERGVPLEESVINWEERVDWNEPDYQAELEELFVPEEEQFNYLKEIDTRKLIYDYYWVDYEQAARTQSKYNYETQSYDGTIIGIDGAEELIQNRSSFLMHESVPVYPDTLVWVRDFTYSYNEPLTLKYFSHVGFDEYPVVGISWKQAEAFCNWRTNLFVSFRSRLNETPPHDFRLPTEAEWEYASRGGYKNALYPWGSYYTRNQEGCFVANFKPLRGNYVADSPSNVTTMMTGTFDPNAYGLYDMAGNVAEWTSDAFYEAAYDIISDFNPHVSYNARPDDPPVLKRKVLRGGSWKDIPYFIQNATRSFEYQDSTKSYVGFRCVRTSFRNELKNR